MSELRMSNSIMSKATMTPTVEATSNSGVDSSGSKTHCGKINLISRKYSTSMAIQSSNAHTSMQQVSDKCLSAQHCCRQLPCLSTADVSHGMNCSCSSYHQVHHTANHHPPITVSSNCPMETSTKLCKGADLCDSCRTYNNKLNSSDILNKVPNESVSSLVPVESSITDDTNNTSSTMSVLFDMINNQIHHLQPTRNKLAAKSEFSVGSRRTRSSASAAAATAATTAAWVNTLIMVAFLLQQQLLFICPPCYARSSTIINAGNPDAKRLYDDLLSNYNKLVRPVVNTSDPLQVMIKLKLSQLIDVVSNLLLSKYLLFECSNLHKTRVADISELVFC